MGRSVSKPMVACACGDASLNRGTPLLRMHEIKWAYRIRRHAWVIMVGTKGMESWLIWGDLTTPRRSWDMAVGGVAV